MNSLSQNNSLYIRALMHAREVLVKSGNTKGIKELDKLIEHYRSLL